MELFDLYDENRIKTSETIERDKCLPANRYRQVIHIVIFNSKNQMLIQQRVKNKKHWSNLWDISLGGCCQTNESSKLAAYRELREELGIEYDFSLIRPFFTINFEEGFDDFYLINMDVDIKQLKLQKEEVQNAMWANKTQISQLFKNGQFIPYYKSFIFSLFDLKNKRGIHK